MLQFRGQRKAPTVQSLKAGDTRIIRGNKDRMSRQTTPTGTCGRGIGWGIALPDEHEQQERVPRLHIGTERDSRADK